MLKKPIYVTKPLLPELEDFYPYLEDIWSSKWVTNHGKYHNLLETELQNVLKVPHLSLFNNGTMGLLVALKALDLPEGSEVITTPFTFAATPHAISWSGLKPVFADIEPETMTIDPSNIEELITPNTSAILAVHIYGFPAKVEKIQEIADKFNLKVIYDAAHAFSTEIEGKGIGTYGDISMFSFHATKLFNCIEGGALTYNNSNLVDQIYSLRNFGIMNEDTIVSVGLNGKANELQAAIGLLNLECYKKEQEKRQIVKQLYDNYLSSFPFILIPKMPVNVSNSLQYYVIRIIQDGPSDISRDKVYHYLKQHNIYTRKYFYPLCTDYVPYRSLGSERTLPQAYTIAEEVLSLPFYGELKEEEVLKICALIKEAKYE